MPLLRTIETAARGPGRAPRDRFMAAYGTRYPPSTVNAGGARRRLAPPVVDVVLPIRGDAVEHRVEVSDIGLLRDEVIAARAVIDDMRRRLTRALLKHREDLSTAVVLRAQGDYGANAAHSTPREAKPNRE
jgi:hypothetical protein